MEDAIRTTLLNVVNSLRDKNMVCCLTARNDNRKMWEEYSEKYTGFVVEYDLTKLLESDQCELISKLFPVTYYKRMPKVPLLPFIEYVFYKELYGKKIDINKATKQLCRQLLCKDFDYRSEEEWRIVSEKHKVDFPCISAVYAGNKISNENQEKLKVICSKRGIPLYKQQFRLYNGEMYFELID